MSPWQTSDRRDRLPPNWSRLVQLVKERAGGRCQARLPSRKRCPRDGAQCDHIVAGDNHDLSNLQWLCEYHHERKTVAEAAEARRAERQSRYRPREDHPGAIL